MRELSYIADRFSDLLKEMPVSSYAGFLEETRRKIKNLSDRDGFYIDVFTCTNASAESKQLTRSLQESAQNSSYNLVVKDENTSGVRVFEQVFASLGFVLLDETMLQCEPLQQLFKKTDSPYKVIF